MHRNAKRCEMAEIAGQDRQPVGLCSRGDGDIGKARLMGAGGIEDFACSMGAAKIEWQNFLAI